ncbi:MAG: cation diffusion facilitator family transporter [Micrococcaceae bacterium]
MSAGHEHSHVVADNRKVLIVVLSITFSIFLVEVIGVVMTDSLALIADAGHMLVDSLGLMMALITAFLVHKEATNKHTWGLRRAEVISAMGQALVLLGVGLYILVEGIRRFYEPVELPSNLMLYFGAFGLLANLLSFVILVRSSGDNFNIRAASLEVLNDALGSVAVIVAAIVIKITGWYQADALVSILIGMLILPRTIKLLRDTMSVLLEATPTGLDLTQVKKHILRQDHVTDIHDIHASQIDSALPVLTAHVVLDDECLSDKEHYDFHLKKLRDCLTGHFDISVEHTTFQLESQEFASDKCKHLVV